jgi:hypothetical protein
MNAPLSSELQLSHWSEEPELVPRSVEQKLHVDGYRSEFDKPCGLWVSVDGEDGWEAWCTSENFGGLHTYRYRVRLTKGSNVLHIDNELGVRVFREKYGRQSDRSYCSMYIAWEDVARDYQGLIIAPYQWPCRMDERWYYGWDCASGCLWDAAAFYVDEPMRKRA